MAHFSKYFYPIFIWVTTNTQRLPQQRQMYCKIIDYTQNSTKIREIIVPVRRNAMITKNIRTTKLALLRNMQHAIFCKEEAYRTTLPQDKVNP